MGTVIDELFVLLKLDASQFTKAQKEQVEGFIKTKEEAARTGKQLEESGKQGAQFFTKLRNEALGFLAVLIGAKDVKDFVVGMTKLNAETGRQAQIFGTTAQTIATWRGAVQSVGGDANSANNTIRNLTMEYQKFALTGESSLLPYLRALGVYLQDEKTGKMKDFTQFMIELSTAIERLSKTDPARATAILNGLGFDEATIYILQQGPEKLRQLLDAQSRMVKVTDEDTKAALELTKAWNEASRSAEGFGRTILTFLTPALVGALKAFAHPVDFITGGATGGKNVTLGESLAILSSGGFYIPDGSEGSPLPVGSSAAAARTGGYGSAAEREAYIREAARKRGIDPEIAVRVAKSEGFKKYYGDYDATGKPTSFGDFQLHYPGIGRNTADGLGSVFTRQTGLDARDPSTWREQIDFSLDQAVKGGWGPWHGWRGASRAGLPNMPVMAGGSEGKTVSSTVSIGSVTINTQATDAQGIAQSIKPAIEQANLGMSANAGAQ